MWAISTYVRVASMIKKCSHNLDTASKSYSQIKRKRRNDNQQKSDIAKLTRTELPGFWRRVLTRQMAQQTQMLPTKFAMTVGPRTAVCTAVDTILGDDAVKVWPEPRDPSKESPMLDYYKSASLDYWRSMFISGDLTFTRFLKKIVLFLNGLDELPRYCSSGLQIYK